MSFKMRDVIQHALLGQGLGREEKVVTIAIACRTIAFRPRTCRTQASLARLR